MNKRVAPSSLPARNLRDIVDDLQRVPVVELENDAPPKPKVSVVVPTFRHAAFIGECLGGILAQKFSKDFEVLVGEDASDDGTREMCVAYARRNHSTIRLFLHDAANKMEIGGQKTGRFNLVYLLSRAKGEFICLCEGDDYWRDPDKLTKQYAAMLATPGAILAFADSLVMRDGRLGEERFLRPDQRRDLTAVELAVGARIPTQTVMFRNVLKTEPLPLDYFKAFNGDSYLFSFLSLFGDAVYVGDVLPSVYRIHGGGLWSSKEEGLRATLALHTTQLKSRLHSDRIAHGQLQLAIFRQLVSLSKARARRGRLLMALVAMVRAIGPLLSRPKSCLSFVSQKASSRLRGLFSAAHHG